MGHLDIPNSQREKNRCTYQNLRRFGSGCLAIKNNWKMEGNTDASLTVLSFSWEFNPKTFNFVAAISMTNLLWNSSLSVKSIAGNGYLQPERISETKSSI
jgi:hypothetical protein